MKRLLIIAVILPLLFACSSHQKRIDTISDVMHQFNSAYEEAELLAITLHENGALTGEKWNLVVGVRNRVAPAVIRLNENWKRVPQTDASVEAFIAQPDFQNAVMLALELANLATANNAAVKLHSLVR